jgi:carbamoyltransferase
LYILGISCYYHDSAAAIIRDGEIVAAAQEERFTRKKHDFNFPSNAIAYCLFDHETNPHRMDDAGLYPGLGNTRLLLGAFFYLILTPIGLVMRLAGKDYLEKQIDRSATTYWIKREPVPMDQKRYENLF